MSSPMNLTCTLPQAARLVIRAWTKNKTPMITGSPGLGKSAIITQIAKEHNLKVIDLRLAQCDPTDLNGFPTTNDSTGKASYLPMDTFPLETDPIPDGYTGWVLLLDELTHADRSVQKAAYKLILDHMVGSFKLHPKCWKIGAGNLATDNAHVEEMGTALQSRLIHLVVSYDSDAFMDWAINNGIDTRVLAYLNYKPTVGYNFQPDHTDMTYPCPRTWEFTSDLIEDYPDIGKDQDTKVLLAGTIGKGAALEFCKFTEIYDKLLKVSDILINPETITVPTAPDQLYALSGSIADHIDETNVETLLKFIKRMGGEFQIMVMTLTLARNRSLLNLPTVMTWVGEIAKRTKIA